MHKNDQLTKLIEELKKASYTHKVGVWKRIAEDLQKPTRQRRIINLSKISMNSSEDEIVIVPGKVLGSGEVDKKLTIAAYQFSGSAEQKIKQAKGTAMNIPELLKKNPKAQKVRILG